MRPLLEERLRPNAIAIAIALSCGVPSLFGQTASTPAPPPTNINHQAVLCDLPVGDGPVEVSAAFHLSEINAIDDEAETFEFSGVLTVVWRDSRQGFDPASAGVDEKFYHGEFQFNELSPGWYPQMILTNASGIPEMQGVLLRVAPDGTCTLIQTVNAVARARFDLRRYPFDRQEMEAVFEVLGFSSQEVVMKTDPSAVASDYSRVEVPQWKLLDMTTSCRTIGAPYSGPRGAQAPGAPGTSSAFVVTLDMKRESMFMVRLVIAPLMLIAMLSWSVFWMDQSSLGDRMSVSFVGLLTAVAYQVVVSDIMPHISYMTLTTGYLNLSFLAMAAAIVINLVVGHYDQNGNPIRGSRIDHRCRRVFPLVYALIMLGVTAIAFIFF